MRDNNAKNIMATNKSFGDCHILMEECEAVPEAILIAIKKNIPKACIHSDSQVVVNAINAKIGIPKDIINLVKNIRYLLLHIKESRLECCNKNINTEADAMAKMAYM